MTLQPFSPDLAFLGTREYLHGSTLFEGMIDGLQSLNVPQTDLDFIFERRTDRRVRIVSDEPEGSAVKVATLRHTGGVLTAVETEEPIRHRQAYSKSELAKAFVTRGDAIAVEGLAADYSFLPRLRPPSRRS